MGLTKRVQESIQSSPTLQRTLLLQQESGGIADQTIEPCINPFLVAFLDNLTKNDPYQVEKVLSPKKRHDGDCDSWWRFGARKV
jgi:hypothetical protein